eukprot:5042515-Prymnesium_polylepis.1
MQEGGGPRARRTHAAPRARLRRRCVGSVGAGPRSAAAARAAKQPDRAARRHAAHPTAHL